MNKKIIKNFLNEDLSDEIRQAEKLSLGDKHTLNTFLEWYNKKNGEDTTGTDWNIVTTYDKAGYNFDVDYFDGFFLSRGKELFFVSPEDEVENNANLIISGFVDKDGCSRIDFKRILDEVGTPETFGEFMLRSAGQEFFYDFLTETILNKFMEGISSGNLDNIDEISTQAEENGEDVMDYALDNFGEAYIDETIKKEGWNIENAYKCYIDEMGMEAFQKLLSESEKFIEPREILEFYSEIEVNSLLSPKNNSLEFFSGIIIGEW